ncbi:PAAR domain-containing protein, partial [Campylobacter troglodytis]
LNSHLNSNTPRKIHKKIIEICFSFCEEMIKLEGDSKHSSDLNLHINTSGYKYGEMIRLNIEFK